MVCVGTSSHAGACRALVAAPGAAGGLAHPCALATAAGEEGSGSGHPALGRQ